MLHFHQDQQYLLPSSRFLPQNLPNSYLWADSPATVVVDVIVFLRESVATTVTNPSASPLPDTLKAGVVIKLTYEPLIGLVIEIAATVSFMTVLTMLLFATFPATSVIVAERVRLPSTRLEISMFAAVQSPDRVTLIGVITIFLVSASESEMVSETIAPTSANPYTLMLF